MEQPPQSDRNDGMWWQIVIPDPDGLPGRNLAALLLLVTSRVPVPFVAIHDVEGAGDSIRMLQGGDDVVVMSISELIATLSGVEQFDWGDFFLVESEFAALALKDCSRRIQCVAQSLVTIRAVGDHYFYVYGRDEAVWRVVYDAYSPHEWKRAPIDDLAFPA